MNAITNINNANITHQFQNNDNNTKPGFDSWMFQQHHEQPNNNNNMSDSSSWFEPLENIISSASTSSMGSPLNDELISNNDLHSAINSSTDLMNILPKQEEGQVDNNNDLFGLTLSKLLKKEDNDDALLMSFNNDDADISSPEPQQGDAIHENNTKQKKLTGKVARKVSKPNRKKLTQNQKEAHNKIEKRYRININTKIAKLQQIIPWVASEHTAFETNNNNQKNNANDNNNNNTPTGPSARLNKSMILEKAVDYILYLQNNERLYEMEVMRLKNELETYRRSNNCNTN